MENIISVLHSFTQNINAEASSSELELTRRRIQKGLELLELMLEKDSADIIGSKKEECDYVFAPTFQEILNEVNLLLADELGNVAGGIVGFTDENPLDFPTVLPILREQLEMLDGERAIVWWINEDDSTCFSLLPRHRLPKKEDFDVYISSTNENIELVRCDEREWVSCDICAFIKSFVFFWEANSQKYE
ncbi:hypothetical protein D1R32_gp064 [Tunisvirus fontaine2]|uniref:Uncharacterized protein n=1 Tax=Tunisvirus fontaine2 TaxID=1421067 RepID=V9SEP6_9VIRU|nr:hypothetical protein D1R32_gp064 [Tunisvirus fontaine2]AHC54781.1 hypothetical protein TNS_ORF63 [Tunisvirus fontaine2]